MIAIKPSKILEGRPPNGSPNPRIRITSTEVSRTPCHSCNFGKSRHRAMAEPNNSAKSVAIIAISARAYKG